MNAIALQSQAILQGGSEGSGLKRLAFQNAIIRGADCLEAKFTGSSLEQIESVGQIDSLEFRSCDVCNLDMLQLIANNQTLEKIVFENTVSSDSLEKFPNYAGALLKSEGQSNLRKFQWSPKIEDGNGPVRDFYPKADFWSSFEEILLLSDARFAPKEPQKLFLRLENFDLNDIKKGVSHITHEMTGIKDAKVREFVDSCVTRSSSSITQFNYINKKPLHINQTKH